ncbi:MAG: sigma 54-interacting transcriptional regulator [Deltaproteobacteria bacterium]|nr:sigma 54-interacting transcriptional regulator [Deltaproteobacteria bacterium]
MNSENKNSWRQVLDDTAELLPCIVCEVDTELRLIWVNQLGLDTFRYSAKEYQNGIDVSQMFETEDRELALTNFARLISNEEFDAPNEYRLARRDGTFAWYQVRAARILRDGKVIGVRACLWDLTEKKLAEQRLAESEERFRRIFFQSPNGVALFRGDGTFVEGNISYQQMMGAGSASSRNAKDNATNKQLNLFSVVTVADAARAVLQRGAVIRNEASSVNVDVKGNTDNLYDWVITPLRFDGNPDAMLLFQIQDVTARVKEQQEKLDLANRIAKNAVEKASRLKARMLREQTFENMVAQSDAMKKIFALLPQMAQTDTTVLVVGESGTGKELVARAIHKSSPRANKPFVAINCGALPDTLLEAELFGYRAGAFTDAKKDKPGKFTQANGGVIFLDEIGDISQAMQVKLLRVLQEKVAEPLGATHSEKVDVKVVAATNKDLSQMVQTGAFRQDLFYRINVLKVTLPPLRERLSDVPLLCDHFVEKYNGRFSKEIEGVSKEALDVLLRHNYPGNIRELENIIEHAFIFCNMPTIHLNHLPEELAHANGRPASLPMEAVSAGVTGMDELEAAYIQSMLAKSGGNKTECARIMGIHKATLFRKIKKLGL